MNTNGYVLIEKNDIRLSLHKAKLYSKLCQFRVQNINFLHPIFALHSNPEQTMLLRIMTIKFPCIRNSTTLFPNIWAFNSNFKQYMLLKKMSEFFTKTIKNRGLCLLY